MENGWIAGREDAENRRIEDQKTEAMLEAENERADAAEDERFEK